MNISPNPDQPQTQPLFNIINRSPNPYNTQRPRAVYAWENLNSLTIPNVQYSQDQGQDIVSEVMARLILLHEKIGALKYHYSDPVKLPFLKEEIQKELSNISELLKR
jgi:hypothetical protein